jgi:hypothetical protein
MFKTHYLGNRTRKGSHVMLTTKRPYKPLPATLAHLNELLDEALEETFPASDPIAIAVELESAGPETGPGPDVELRVRRSSNRLSTAD